MHPSLDILFSAGRDAVCRVWDMRTRAAVHTLSGHSNAIASIAVQGTDPQVITGSMDSTIRLWDLVAGKTMAVLTHHSKAVRALTMGAGPGPVGAVGRSEHSFVSGGADCVRKWHAGTGQFLFGMRGHRSMVHSLACNDDGVLFSGADDGGVRFTDVATGHCFQSEGIAVQPGSLDSEAAVFCSTFDMTGTRLITGGADKTVRIWGEVPGATPDSHPVDMDEYKRQVKRAEEPGAI
jgi:pleiotropic regulator 1